MLVGVYFPQRSEYSLLASLGITLAVRPTITPATGPNDAGFVSANSIESTTNKDYSEVYGADEADDPQHPERLQSPPGSFVNISNGGWGRRDHLLPATLHRGLLNGGGDLLIGPIRCWWSAEMALRHWGTNWTVVLYATPKLRRALNFYRRLGIARAFIWRWDYNQDMIRGAL